MKKLLELGVRRYTPNLKIYSGLPGLPAAAALLDILILGTLFFARSGNESRLAGFQVEVPQVKNAAVKNVSFLQKNIISLMPSEKAKEKVEIFFRNRPVELTELQSELQKSGAQKRKFEQRADLRAKGVNTDFTVLLMIDRSIPFEHIAPVLAAIGNAGLKCYLPVTKDSKDQSFEL